MKTVRWIRAVLGSAVLLSAGSAHAFDLSKLNPFRKAAAQQSAEATAVRYKTLLEVDVDVRERLEQASLLKQGESEPPADIAGLVARARADKERLRAALYETGHYAGRVRVMAGGRELSSQTQLQPAAEPLEIVIAVQTGPVFRFARVEIASTDGRPLPGMLDVAALGLIEGEIARSTTISKALQRLIEEWRAGGHPFARVTGKEISADHAATTLHVRITIDPGAQGTYGWVNVIGADTLSDDLVSRYSKLKPGRRYHPDDIKEARDRLRKLDAIESVRVLPGDAPDAAGGVPVTLAVTERKPRFVGFSAGLSSVDGGELQAYWGHRNLFGGAEKLRLEGGLSQIGDGGLPALQYYARATLTKPAVYDIDTDLVAEAGISRERPETYESRAVKAKIGLAHRFSETRTASMALAGLLSREEDVTGTRSYAVASLPAEFAEDRRNNRLDATEGWRAMTGVEPAYDLHNDAAFAILRGQLSTYLAMDPERRVVLAGRLETASILGADAGDLPPSQRLYAGGGGSVRGYGYRSIGPLYGGEVIGGRALLAASAELRLRVTPTIGLVPFIDVASVGRDAWPDLSELKAGAGIGLRYYTALGPIRLDVAVPLEAWSGAPDVAFYVGLGQAF